MILLTSCSSIAKGNEKVKQKKQVILDIINGLENQGFVPMKGHTKDNHLFFNINMNDQETSFMLDSGASYSLITYSRAEELGLISDINKTTDSQLTTMYGTINKGAQLELDSFDIPGISFTNWPIHLVDSKYKKVIVGVDFLNYNSSILFCKYAILLNSVLAQSADSLDVTLKDRGYVSTPLVDFYGNPVQNISEQINPTNYYIKMKINRDKEELLLLDTGGAFTSLNDVFTNFDLITVKRTNMRMMDATGKGKDLYMVKLDSLVTNNHKFMGRKNISLTNENYTPGTNQIYGVLALDFLNERDAIIDFGNGVLYFKEAEEL